MIDSSTSTKCQYIIRQSTSWESTRIYASWQFSERRHTVLAFTAHLNDNHPQNFSMKKPLTIVEGTRRIYGMEGNVPSSRRIIQDCDLTLCAFGVVYAHGGMTVPALVNRNGTVIMRWVEIVRVGVELRRIFFGGRGGPVVVRAHLGWKTKEDRRCPQKVYSWWWFEQQFEWGGIKIINTVDFVQHLSFVL